MAEAKDFTIAEVYADKKSSGGNGCDSHLGSDTALMEALRYVGLSMGQLFPQIAMPMLNEDIFQQVKIRELSTTEIADYLERLRGWRIDQGKLHKKYKLDDFAKASTFMSSIALLVESCRHYAERLNVSDAVEIWLATPDANGISNIDIFLAHLIDRLYATI